MRKAGCASPPTCRSAVLSRTPAARTTCCCASPSRASSRPARPTAAALMTRPCAATSAPPPTPRSAPCCSCCGRDLDRAQEYALKAVELAPDNSGHLDTLAEVYFQRGERDKALATERRAQRLAPQRLYLRKQLARMEAGDPKAPLPPEDDDD